MNDHDDHARALRIAEYLTLTTGEPWEQRADQHGRDNIIFGPTLGEHLFISTRPPNRIEIYGSLTIGAANLYTYLRRYDYTPDHTITVRADRPPAQIAKAITRRLLPAYRRDLAAGLARFAAAEQRRRQVEQIAAEIAAGLNGGVHTHNGEGDSFYDGLAGCSVTGYVSSPESVTFEIRSANLATARAIVQAIRATNLPTS